MRLQIEQAGAEVLHRPARALSPAEIESDEVQRLIDLMFATLVGTGVGLAAPQVGVGLRLAVIEDRSDYHAQVSPSLLKEQEREPVLPFVLINPVLTPESDTVEFFEGCLSVNGYRAVVPRARVVRVQALDRTGSAFEMRAAGWLARILQHEVDHLDGRLYIERMRPRTFMSASAASVWSARPPSELKRMLGDSAFFPGS